MNFTTTESPPVLRAAVGPEMSSDSNVYDAMAKFVRGRDDDRRGLQERPNCAAAAADDDDKRRHSCPRCALNAACFGNASNPWHPSDADDAGAGGGDCPRVWRWSRRDLEDSPRFRNLSVVMFGDSRIRVVFGALLRKFYATDDPVFT